MRNLLCILAALLIAVFLNSAGAEASPAIEARSGILINGRTGEVLWEKEGHTLMHPASTTKILTAILLLENASLDDMAVTSKKASRTIGSSLYLTEGQQIRVEDLLYAIILHSANDASVVAAEHVAGSVAAFAAMMNMKAKQAGALKSNFTNPHGISERDHLTTAYDLAMIARYAMANEQFRNIAAAKQHTMKWTDGGSRTIRTKIPLMESYEGMIGIKAGYTGEARRTFVGAAERNGLELIAVVLSTSGSGVWDDTVTLLEYGFTKFASVRPVNRGDILGSLPVRYGGSVFLEAASDFEITGNGAPLDVTYQLETKDVRAPVVKGMVLGKAVILQNGQAVGSVDAVAAEDVPRKLPYTGRFWFTGIFGALGCLRVRKLYRRARRKKMRRKRRDYRFKARKFR